METIISYIDNLFRNYPDTPKVKAAKEELLAIMEDKYHELKAEGKSENEAIGIVISEFGSMDEIAFELGLDKETIQKQKSMESQIEEKRLSLEQAQNYIKTEEAFGYKIGAGVFLCILSPVISIFTEALTDAGFLPKWINEVLGPTGLILFVAIAVGIFITSGLSHEKFEEYKQKRILLGTADKNILEAQFEDYNKTFGKTIAAGVILCILSVIPVILTNSLFEHTSLEWISDISAIFLFGFAADGVFIFISAGTKHGAYETLLGKGKSKKIYSSESERKKDKRISILASIYWPVITAIYLAWSFIRFDWGVSWIIWPIAGIIFGGISAVISLVSSE